MKTIILLLLICFSSCSFSYEQGYSYDNKKGKMVKVKGCKHKIERPKPEWRLGY